MSRCVPTFVTVVLALVLLAPSLVLGTLISHSSPQNLTWAAQFADQFRAGVLYPRWMPDSFEGLGGPAFYFYPPLPFWLDALVSVATANVLSVPYRLSITWLLLLWASGLAMHAWIKNQTHDPRIALFGALAYMAAPYHLFDHYTRGALAEFSAYAFLPLVLLWIRQPALLALAYAGLLLSHLPTALLVSVTIFAPYALFHLREPRTLLRTVAGGMLGIGLAAIYLVPALLLQRWISADQLWTAFYQAERWLLLAWSRWPDPDTMKVVAFLAAAYAVAAAGLCVFFRRRGDAVFWAALTLVCLALMSGIAPWFWQVPLFAKVQFPWRLLLAVEFAVLSALCLAAVGKPGRAGLYVVVAAALVLVPAGAQIGSDIAARIAFTREHRPLPQQDAKEYEPRGYPLAASATYAQLGLEPLAGAPLVSCTPTPRICRAEPGRFGTLRVEIEGDAPTDVVLRRFFFPAWRLDPAVPLTAKPPLQLVSFAVAPGRHSYRLERTALPEEQWGWVISAASLVLLLVAARLTARSSSPAGS
jgi:hypothetical protein